MKNKILLTMLLALVLIFSAGAISASDVNMTDSDALSSSDDNVELESDVESADSNTLSANNEDTSLGDDIKNQTELTSPTATAYSKGSYSITLKDSNTSSVVANRTVHFVIDNVNYNAATDNNGVARIDLTLTPGKYTVISYFLGDDEYEASQNLTSALEVLSTIKSSDISKYYKGSTQYSATFLDSQGNVLANRDVTITVNGKTYKKKTNANGVAYLPMDLNPGTYKVVSTNPVTGDKSTTTFKVLSTISAKSINKVTGDSKKFSAKFLKSNGKALANKYIKFKLKGKTYKVKTNSKGIAGLSLKNLKKGTYKISCYNKDGLVKTYKIKVYNKVSTRLTAELYTFLKSDSKKIRVTLTSSLGYAPPAGQTVKITINGKTYSKKTNSKGVATLKLPSLKKGVYAVKYNYNGASHYKSSGASNYVIIITTKNPTLAVKSTTTFGYGAATPLKVSVTAGGVPLIKRAVAFEINGKTYTRTTDNNGIASLPIKLKIGNYTVKYSIKQEPKVNAKSASVPIVVKERGNSTLTWKSEKSFSSSAQTIKVLLTDANGKAISGQTVKLTLKSKTYSATTASNGYATFKTVVSSGKYSVSVKFNGNNEYNSSSATESISVTAKSYALKKGVNEINTISDLSTYLKSSKNCQVGNSKIKTLVDSLTKGLTSDEAKATAIFNYVRDTLAYSFYYNTKYGAVTTLNVKKGNCVDHSHLLVAMFRTAGLAARYVHGTCRFSSGGTYGHVWTQVLIGDTWVVADATSTRNSFGKIVNWNTNSFSLHNRYASLPF